MKCYSIGRFYLSFIFILLFAPSLVRAQTESDAIMMFKNNICFGPTFSYSSWTNYWEGTHKRDNANLGKVSTKAYTIMANYGISNTLNVMVGLPYIQTKASAGQLHSMNGVQDFSLWLKWQPVQKEIGKGIFSLFTLGGYALPASSYNADFMPLSIGSGSKSLSIRVMGDYQLDNWFATASATYVRRENIKIDREAYYTTEMHYTNEVKMPDAAQFNFRAGLRTGRWIAEAVANNATTLGGFDITKNNMPFPSNRMNMTTVGAHFKYETTFLTGLS
ncbi:MAG TPA: hypothetical protein VGB56_06410, partial [Flavisolibacter sp.]